MTRITKNIWIALAAFALAVGCAHAPRSQEDAKSLEQQADEALASLTQEDPTLQTVLAQSEGYVVFPRVREGAFIAGATSGVGVVYEGDRPIGYAELDGGSFGAQVGGQSYTQLIVFRSSDAFERFKLDNFDLSADVSATAIRSGSAASATFEGGTAVFIDDEDGLMAEASVGGQSLRFEPRR
ncbi:MAG: lipid-binding SYLF domain-containing protein [Sandaracinaceae bacterium]|nr:MAG: hypothetical protein EVA89_17230 [Sandaracinaceae bacterium]